MMADKSENQERPLPGHGGPHGHHGHRRNPWHMRFSEEEMRVWKECKRDGTMYRALPLAAVLGMFTYAAVGRGYLKPNVRFGAAPKVVLAMLVGYGVGKLSYHRTCMRRMMELPDSRYAQLLKTREGNHGPWPALSAYGSHDDYAFRQV
ncbi:OCIA domain-containing protein 1-like isoform X2 [Anticarsia gemmatalis]|uniref:OCIA domain-containing protein 1-like isoform X2 n=1 Tax=Anticarsia gemmatalis TaxID=129554 RepID=UPI003F7685B3